MCAENKVIFVESYPHVLFGQQRTLLSLLDQCHEQSIEPLVIVTSDGPFVDEVMQRSISILTLPYPELLASYGGVIYTYRGFRRLKILWQGWMYILKIRKFIKEQAADAVFCNDMRGLLTVGVAARLLGLPVMIWDKLDKPHGWLDMLQLMLVNINIIISDSVRVKYPRWQQKIFRKKITKIFNGADLKRFDEVNSIRNTLPVKERDIVIAIIGTITRRKGHDRVFCIWLELLNECPDLRLLIVGETTGSEEDKHYFDSLKSHAHPRIHFLGMRSDVPNIMKSIDILLVPSRHEGMGQVVVEAMAASVPVIGANAGGIPEVVMDGVTGVIFDGDDHNQLKEKIIMLSSSIDLRKTMGSEARLRAERFFNRQAQMQRVLNMLSLMAQNKKLEHIDEK